MKPLLLHLILALAMLNLAAQKTEYFDFSSSLQTTGHAAFDSVEFADNRLIQDYIGITHRKSDKKLVPLWLRRPLADEFKNNRPRLTSFVAVMARDELRKVMRSGTGDGESLRISRSDIFAVSDGQHVWVAAPLQYARLNKRGWDFYFRTTAYENNKVEEIALSYFFFSIPGAIIAAIPHETMYEFRLNHLNGKYILLRRAAD